MWVTCLLHGSPHLDPHLDLIQALVLAVPLTFAVTALGAMIIHSFYDWEQRRDLDWYVKDPQKAETIAQAYRQHPIADYFKRLAANKSTYGVFQNEIGHH